MNPTTALPGLPTAKKAYAIHRAGLAARRMLKAQTLADEIRAGLWAVAWAMAAGAQSAQRRQGRQAGKRPPATLEVTASATPDQGGGGAVVAPGKDLRRRLVYMPALGEVMPKRSRHWRFGRRAH